MSTLIHPQAMTIDGLSIRFAEGGKGSQQALLVIPEIGRKSPCHIRTDCM